MDRIRFESPLRGVAMLCWLAAVAGCGEGEAEPPAAAVAAPEIVRTGDPTRRGLAESDFPRVQELAPGVYSYEQLRSAGDERFATVSLFVVTDDGVLVADGQGSVEETRRLVETIAGVTDRPITHLVIGSDHGDHTAGNSAFPPGVQVFAHPTSAAALRSGGEGPPEWLGRTQLVDDSVTLRLGGREIRLLFLGRAHTGGDLMVHLPAEKILFMSEAYLNRIFPAMRSAYPSEWIGVLERARAMDIDVYVPGHGFVEAPAILEQEVDTFRTAIERVVTEARRLHGQGLDVDTAAARAAFGPLDDWTLRSSQGPIAVRRVWLELDGGLPPPGS